MNNETIKIPVEINISELDRYVKHILKEDLGEYKYHILREAKESGDDDEVKRLTRLIDAYELILRENYKYVPELEKMT